MAAYSEGDAVGDISKTEVLVVEDTDELRKLVERYLAKRGYVVHSVGDAESALPWVGRVSVVITDISLPGKDGHWLLGEVQRRDPRAVVIMMTGQATLESAIEAIHQGASDYLVKPIDDLEVLVLTLERALRRRELLTEVLAMRRVARLKDEFMSIVGHELRTPMTVIGSTLELIRESAIGGGLDPDDLRMVEAAEDSLARLHRVLEDIFLLKDLQWSGQRLEGEMVDLQALIGEQWLAYADYAAERQVVLEPPSGLEDLPLVHSATQPLARALGHLIENAVKFNRPGGRVRIAAARAGDTIRLDVVDTARPIEEEDRLRIFDLFQQTEDPLTRTRDGAGLGLPLVRAVVLAMGGQVELAPAADGEGNCFRLVLPLAPEGT